ncbi:MAG: alpha/beta fold hydrolase [Planctomycetaceae bacterium]
MPHSAAPKSSFSRGRAGAVPVALAVALMVAGGGCAKFVGKAMTTAPNAFHPFGAQPGYPPAVRQAIGIDQELRVPVGPPDATLAVAIVEPPEFDAPRGTIIVLHGIGNSSFWMTGTARRLAEQGFRAVLVDLRGHGRSTGDRLTFGQQESRDLVQVVDHLERRNLLAGRLGVYGISYGAATAIQFAGLDPRVDCVVAVAPFSAMRDVVPDYGRTMLPGVERMISDRFMDESIAAAGVAGEFDPDRSSSIEAIRRSRAQVLIVHGTEDWLVPPYHAVRLQEAAPDRTKLVLLPRTGHVSIWFDFDGDVATETRGWFEQWL